MSFSSLSLLKLNEHFPHARKCVGRLLGGVDGHAANVIGVRPTDINGVLAVLNGPLYG